MLLTVHQRVGEASPPPRSTQPGDIPPGQGIHQPEELFQGGVGEVSTRRTQRELQEMVSATAPLTARLELVLCNILHTTDFRDRERIKTFAVSYGKKCAVNQT